MDLFQLHSIVVAGWLVFQGIGDLLAPGLVGASLIKETRSMTDLETLLFRAGGLVKLAYAIISISMSGALASFLSGSSQGLSTSASQTSDTPSSSHTPAQKTLLAASTFLTATTAILFYTATTNTRAFSSVPFGFETLLSSGLCAVGGGLLLFGTGAGSNVKGRSHALFDTPEHRAEVKERHKAKKEG